MAIRKSKSAGKKKAAPKKKAASKKKAAPKKKASSKKKAAPKKKAASKKKAAPKKKTASDKTRTRATAKPSSTAKASGSEIVYSDIRSALQSSIWNRLL